MTKKDEDNPDYIGIVLCSKGLGANYVKKNPFSVTHQCFTDLQEKGKQNGN